jgi:hypothetical protein
VNISSRRTGSSSLGLSVNSEIGICRSPQRLRTSSFTPQRERWSRDIAYGLLFRLSNLPKGEGHERRFVNDALVFLQARQLGASVLTGNVRDFDFLTQILPTGRIILYRTPSGPRTS